MKYTVYDVVDARVNSVFDAWGCSSREPERELIFQYSGKTLDEVDFESDAECAGVANKNGIVNNYCALRAITDGGKYTTLFQLWGWTRKNQVVVELQHSVLKRNKIDTSRECYRVAKDKNDNFITSTLNEALAILDDFMSQLYSNWSVMFYSESIETTANKRAESKAN